MTMTLKKEVITHTHEGVVLATLIMIYPEFENCPPGFEKYAARYYRELTRAVKEYAKSDIFPLENERYTLDQTPRKHLRYRALMIRFICEAEDDGESISITSSLCISRGRERITDHAKCECWSLKRGVLIKRKKTK